MHITSQPAATAEWRKVLLHQNLQPQTPCTFGQDFAGADNEQGRFPPREQKAPTEDCLRTLGHQPLEAAAPMWPTCPAATGCLSLSNQGAAWGMVLDAPGSACTGLLSAPNAGLLLEAMPPYASVSVCHCAESL